jgi:hypothetical protein
MLIIDCVKIELCTNDLGVKSSRKISSGNKRTKEVQYHWGNECGVGAEGNNTEGNCIKP